MTVAVTVLTVPDGDAELAADRLMSAGAFAVEERDGLPGSVELRATLGDDPVVIGARLGTLAPGWAWRLEHVPSEPLDTWRQFARPVWVSDDLVLRPAWVDPITTQGVTEVAIEPGAAFGLGDHPTTRLSAAAAWRATSAGDRVLDVGCGTGVLAIVALLAGAARALAIDIAEPAVPVTLANAAANGVGARITASTTALADVTGSFDVVFANILAPVLVEIADDLRRVTAADGRLILSGVLANGYRRVLDALAPMRVVGVDEFDGWAAVTLAHP